MEQWTTELLCFGYCIPFLCPPPLTLASIEFPSYGSDSSKGLALLVMSLAHRMGVLSSEVSGQLAGHCWVLISHPTQRSASSVLPGVGDSHRLGEVRSRAQTENKVSGDADRHNEGESFS